MNQGKWVIFALAAEQNPKTSVWNVLSKEGGETLGQVRWYGRWRKYAFFPRPNTLYENDCLRDIAGFIELAMKVRTLLKTGLSG